MSNAIDITVTLTAGSKAVAVTSGPPVSTFTSGDMLFVAGYLPLVIDAAGTDTLTLRNNSPASLTAAPALLAAGHVPVRDLITALKGHSDQFADWFGRMDDWLNTIGIINVLGPSGEVPVSTLPKILQDVSSQTQDIANNLDLIGNAPAYAALAQQAVTDATAQVTLASNQRGLAETARGGAEDARDLAEDYRDAAAQQVTLASNQRGLAETARGDAEDARDLAEGYRDQAAQQVTLASTQRELAEAARDLAEDYRDQAQQAAQSLTGGLYFAGNWSAAAGSAPPTPTEGAAFYKITAAGTINGIVYAIGDSIIYDNIGQVWFQLDNTDQVTSVNGQMGAVNITLASLGGVASSTTVCGYALTGNITLSYADVGAAAAVHYHSASQITTGTLPVERGGTGRGDGKSTGWATARTLTIGATGKSVDGTGNVAWSLAELGLGNVANYSISNSYTSDLATSYASSKALHDAVQYLQGLINAMSTTVQTGFISTSSSLSGSGEDVRYYDVTISAVSAINKCKVHFNGSWCSVSDPDTVLDINNPASASVTSRATCRLTSTTNLRISTSRSAGNAYVKGRWTVEDTGA